MSFRKFTPEELEKARNVDLYDFLLKVFPDKVYRNGHSLKLRDNRSVTIKEGYKSFYDFGNGDHGGGIDLLMNHFGFSFHEAVALLLEKGFVAEMRTATTTTTYQTKKIVLPEPDICGMNDMVYKYLCEYRGIPSDTVADLINAGLIYQDKYGQLVFINYEKTSFQVRATHNPIGGVISDDKKILSSGRTKSDEFWCSMTGSTADTFYICEGAVDAISLYELNSRKPGIYASMGGASNQAIIDRIVNIDGYHVVLAVDNDDDGQKCRDRNPGLQHLIPQHCKDWNDELRKCYTLV